MAIATFVVVLRHRPRRRSLVVLAAVLGLGVPAQAVLGGVTVLTDLNPWVVSAHLMFSLAMIARRRGVRADGSTSWMTRL